MRQRMLLLLLALSSLAACESTPCVGEACPSACNGTDCAAPEEAGTLAPTNGTTSGRFSPCAADASCDEASGFACVDGTCRHPCRSHFDCGGVGVCQPLGKRGNYCALTSPATTPGGYYSHCPSGECAEGFRCEGAAVADTESYCTEECADDSECPMGFLCDVVFGADSMERKECTPRRFCSECETDGDCLSVPNGVCARDASGAKTCTVVCDPARNSCPWGLATECRVTDEALGVPTCQHRFGACRGEGNGCEPCVRDEDCPGGVCIASLYSGERWCVDREVPCSCAGLSTTQSFCLGPDTGCPASPQGLTMACYDQAPAGNGVCYGVNLPGSSALNSGQLACWR